MEDNMRQKPMLVAVAIIAAPLLVGEASAASAPDVGWAKSQAAAGSIVAHTGYCGRWSWRCSKRWGWRSPRFARCMRRHGC
jgi:hypothetical protein